MVRAILEGRKVQTRRVVNLPADLDKDHPGAVWNLANRPQSWGEQDEWWAFIDSAHPVESYPYPVRCPYGQPGDELWVRETHDINPMLPASMHAADTSLRHVRFRADGAKPWGPWRPSIHMPRWASRLTLRVESVRVERVQEISNEDARAEGIQVLPLQDANDPSAWWQSSPGKNQGRSPRHSFIKLWNSINASRGYSWESNPWGWAVAFSVVKGVH